MKHREGEDGAGGSLLEIIYLFVLQICLATAILNHVRVQVINCDGSTLKQTHTVLVTLFMAKGNTFRCFIMCFLDSTEVDGVPSQEATDTRKMMEELQNRYRQMEERITCPICIDSHIKLVFQCGHGSCTDCSTSLASCPICRQVIQDRIQIFV